MPSQLIVDSIIGRDANGNNTAVVVSAGVSISGGTLVAQSGVNVVGVLTASSLSLSTLTLAGIVTASTYYGSAANMTGLKIATPGNSIGLTFLK